jgi:hypothetical protein
LGYPDSHDLNFSNHPVRTRMPGGVGGDRSDILAHPYPDSEFTETVLAAQQATTDVFFEHGLIPKKIDIREIVWRG